jgi:FMN phosphatase YigB (HAD superfamily)
MAEGQKAIFFDFGGVLDSSKAWKPLIDELKAKQYIVGVATGGLINFGDTMHLLSQSIDLKTDPSFTKIDKTRVETYIEIAQKLDVNISDITFVDDGPKNDKPTVLTREENTFIQAAEQAGAHGIHYVGGTGNNGIEDVRVALQELHYL